MANEENKFLSRADIKFWCFIIGLIMGVVVWGVRLEGIVRVNAQNIDENKEERVEALEEISDKLDELVVRQGDIKTDIAEIKKDIEYIKKEM